MINFFLGVLESLTASILLLLAIKYSSYRRIKPFLGKYNEILQDGMIRPEYKYEVTYNWNVYLELTLRMSIFVKRTNTINDHSDWTGKYISDILDPYYFKGIYIIEDRNYANTLGKDRDGWHELNLFDDKIKRIGFVIHFLTDEKRWTGEMGYFIQKIV